MNDRMIYGAALLASAALHALLLAAPWSAGGSKGLQERYEVRFESGGSAPSRQQPAEPRTKQRPDEAGETAPAHREPLPQEQERGTDAATADRTEQKQSEESRTSGRGEASSLDEYLARVKASVEYNKFYPLFARQLRQEGTVVVRAAIGPDGTISTLQVVSSSGHQGLDRAAEKAVRSSAPFDPPGRFGLSGITVDIPVLYKLR